MPELPAARPQLARRLNTSSVLAYLWSSEVLTVSDLMEATGLTRATTHAVCSDLVRLGWARELEPRREAGALTGRPSKRFSFNEQAGYVLGVDIGEWNINVLLADLKGAVVSRRRVSGLGPRTSPQERVEQVGSLVGEVLEHAAAAPGRVLAAGVGVALPVGKDGSPRRGIFRLDADALSSKLAGIPVVIANDANLAALAEGWVGAAQGADDFITLLTGERLGAGLMESGRLLRGHGGAAGETYFLNRILGPGGAAGIAGLAREWADEAMAAGQPTVLEQWTGDGTPLTAERVFEAAAQDDPVAAQVLDRISDWLARVVLTMAALLDPELVVICGAVAEAAQVLVEPITRRLEAWMDAPPRLARSTLGDAIVAVGAVRLALDHVQQHALELTLPQS